MKKKFLSFIFAFIMMIPCSIIITACGNTNPPADGLTKLDYIEALNSVSTSYSNYTASASALSVWNKFANESEINLLSNANSILAVTMSYNLNDEDFEEANNNSHANGMFRASVAMIDFLKNVLNREDYVLKDGLDDCIVEDTVNSDTFDMRFGFSYDEVSSIIKVPVAVFEDNGRLSYYDFEIVYNFETDTLSEFTISGFSGYKDNITSDGVRYYKFKDNTLYSLPTTSNKFADFAEAKIEELNNFVNAEWETNPENYTQEYMDALMGAFA